MKRFIIISTWFQIIWFCAVLGNYEWQYLSLLFVVGTIAISVVKTEMNWFKWLGIVAVGVVIDFSNTALGLFEFQYEGFPLWLIALWMIFAWYGYFLYPLVSQYPSLIVSIVGGIAGALSYLAGEKFGAVTFGLPFFTVAWVLFLEWFLIIALILRIYGYEVRNNGGNLPNADR
ncbi:DUF2878 domain-containing protein [Vibrio hepatarius]|uniref:DUF2878 domain-containing protein n=1 Tax=Vibrio hepatarius TaxID=171383 RepID=UPI001C083133|nr:DUF2878 domain-containing protein [Vibrio hepatarius]MBU2897857.1 DUF2878 domain-containing protein [Vibrio hepatarius]